ncbi:MADS-box transcription factor [Quillaja saponaria]|uniref:MADS-box transcription factor n=1 Tax=Quillaja saponaria TaxID=32244 RepID=A0AAD7QCH4_QUISA|nr:MADS-box transcription factor [Quillaja saponaria]
MGSSTILQWKFCPSITKTLERYQKCSSAALETSQALNDTQGSYQEYLKLKAKVEVLQRSQRNLLGEDLAPLNTKELEQLENQLEASLKKIRSTKTQIMLDQLADLQNQEQMLDETNKVLRRKLEEISLQVSNRLAWENGEAPIQYNRFPPQSEGFFQSLGVHSNLQIGYNTDHVANVGGSALNGNGFIPGWML